MSFRMLSAHPAYLPLVGAIFAIVALLVLQPPPPNTGSPAALTAVGVIVEPAASTERVRSDATRRLATSPLPARAQVAGELATVRLAREQGGLDSVVVDTAAGQLRFAIDHRTEVLVLRGGRRLVGGPEDIVPGQQAEIELIAGTPVRDGARLARIVVTPSDADRPGATLAA